MYHDTENVLHIMYLHLQRFLRFLVSYLQNYLSPPDSRNIFIHFTYNERNLAVESNK